MDELKLEILESLNEEQQQAVINYSGPVFLVAGPGSGKTRVVVERTKYMILDGVDPSNILLFTFTNKAAREIKERVAMALGEETASYITMGTYHSFCCRLLRQYSTHIGYKKEFTIFDTEDSKKVLSKILAGTDIAPKDMIPYISGKKRKLISPQRALEDAIANNDGYATYYEQYQTELFNQQAMDFDCLIYNAIKLLQSNPEVLAKINTKYTYISADESHDSSTSDLTLIKLLAGSKQNICFILDEDQCLIEGTRINTVDGYKNIEDITTEDKIVVAAGRGETSLANPESISKKETKETVYEIETKTGKKITGTAGHIAFSKIKPRGTSYYVYLMYKHGYGFRIGRTSSVRADKGGKLRNGFEVRLNQEYGDKIWIIHSTDDMQESMMMESYYSYKYGIPQYVFKNDGHGRGMLTQENIHLLYSKLDTMSKGKMLLKDLNLFFEYPHYVPHMRGSGSTRRKLTFTMFGASPKGAVRHLHKTQTSTQNKEYADYISEMANSKTYVSNVKNKEYYLNSISNLDYDTQWANLVKIETDMISKGENFDTVLDAKLTDDVSMKYNFTPFSHLIVGASICIESDGKIIEDEIISINKKEYTGYVYDINVAYYRNYVAEGIVTHNSIYSFRGADISAVLSAQTMYENLKILYLNRNYRCTNTIVEASKSVIAHNSGRLGKKIFAHNDGGDKIIILEEKNAQMEAIRIARTIQLLTTKYGHSYKDIALLYRTNQLSRQFEEIFLRFKIPYEIVSGVNFYQRKEIKDLVAYIQFLVNPYNIEAFSRIINVPRRGIGKTSLEKIIDIAREDLEPKSLLTACQEALERKILKGKARSGLDKFVDIIETLGNLQESVTVPELIREVIKQIDYYTYLEVEYEDGYDERALNVAELIELSYDAETLEQFLETSTLSSNMDLSDEEPDKVQLMTLHMSKGLEYPVVFLVGCNEGTLPFFRATSKESIEEERRLFYVGMTRAKQRLFITRPKLVQLNGYMTSPQMTRYVSEIDESCVYRNK